MQYQKMRWTALLLVLVYYHNTKISLSSYCTNLLFGMRLKGLQSNQTTNERITNLDRQFMRRAIMLAKNANGRTNPNPCVGCVLVDEQNQIVGEGWHEKSGKPHAEVNALTSAGSKALNCTAYVTLEPCNHYGRTPPCTEALIRHGVKRVVAGIVDPDPRVSGKGLKFLESRGLQVDVIDGKEGTDCADLNAAFFHRVLFGKPYVTHCQGLLIKRIFTSEREILNNIKLELVRAAGDMDTVVFDCDELYSITTNWNISLAKLFKVINEVIPSHMNIIFLVNTRAISAEADVISLAKQEYQNTRKYDVVDGVLVNSTSLAMDLSGVFQSNGLLIMSDANKNAYTINCQRKVEISIGTTLSSSIYYNWKPFAQ